MGQNSMNASYQYGGINNITTKILGFSALFILVCIFDNKMPISAGNVAQKLTYPFPPTHHFETVSNSKKLQTTTEMWLLTLTAFENIVEKKEIAHNQQFLLFQQCFLYNQIIVSHLSIFLVSYFHLLLNWNSPKFAYKVKG